MAQVAPPGVKIRPASFPQDVEIVRELFLAYAKALPIKLEFQNFDGELAGLPGKYGVENGGAVFLAFKSTPPSSPKSASDRSAESLDAQEQAIGCIAIRSLTPINGVPTCELKRLYLTPESRGLGVAKLLMDVSLEQARVLGYQEMLLDSLRVMTAARKVYEKYGFEEIEPYYANPNDAVFYRLRL